MIIQNREKFMETFVVLAVSLKILNLKIKYNVLLETILENVIDFSCCFLFSW